MIKFWVVSVAVLLSLYGLGECLECYHCHSGFNGLGEKDATFVPCNERNLTASNIWICPSSNARCIFEVLEVQTTREKQVWRTCSNGITDPCDPNMVPPGMKMISCSHCGTDRCNLNAGNEEEKKTYTFNINANINLNIRQ